MEENKKTQPTRGRKANVKTEEVVTEVVEQKVEVAKEEVKPNRRRLSQIDTNELIPVRSLTKGKLVYVSRATNARYVWSEYGDIEYLTFGELNTMRSQYPRYIKDCLLLIEDDEVIELFNLGNLYETVYSVEELDNIFRKPNEYLSETLPSLPSGIKKAIASRAKELIESDKLTDYNKIKVVQEALKVDLKISLKD